MTDSVLLPLQEQERRSHAAGWIIAIALLTALAFFGIFIWPGVKGVVPRMPGHEGQGININVQLPSDSVPHSGAQNPEQIPDPGAGMQ